MEASDSIELLEPVSAAANTEAAAYRNIMSIKYWQERFIHISEVFFYTGCGTDKI